MCICNTNSKKFLFVLMMFLCTVFVTNASFREFFTKHYFPVQRFAHVVANDDECVCPQSGLSTAATVIDYVGVGGWLYLAGRSFLKAKVPALEREYVLMSPFQKLLSSEWTSAGLTFCGAAAFLQLINDSPQIEFTASVLGGGIPALVSLVQIGFDSFKVLRKIGCFHCCNCCQPKKLSKEDKQKLRIYYKKKKRDLFLKECRLELPIINDMIVDLQREQNDLERGKLFERIGDLDEQLRKIEVNLYLLDELSKYKGIKNQISLCRKNIDTMKPSSSSESTEESELEGENDEP